MRKYYIKIILYFLLFLTLTSCYKEKIIEVKVPVKKEVVVKGEEKLCIGISNPCIIVNENDDKEIDVKLVISKAQEQDVKVLFGIKPTNLVTGYGLREGRDFSLNNSDKSVLFKAGETQTSIKLKIIDNEIVDNNRTAEIYLISNTKDIDFDITSSCCLVVVDNDEIKSGLQYTFIGNLDAYEYCRIDKDPNGRVFWKNIKCPYTLKVVEVYSDMKVKYAITGFGAGKMEYAIDGGIWLKPDDTIEYLPVECTIDATDISNPTITIEKQRALSWHRNGDPYDSGMYVRKCIKQPIELNLKGKTMTFDYRVDDEGSYLEKNVYTLKFDLNL